MKHETELKLQAWLDGELTPAEAEAMRQSVEADPEARALADELRWVRQSLAQGELTLRVPASREFYWSGIERSIRRVEADLEREEATAGRVGWWRWWVPVGLAVALTVLVAAPWLRPFGPTVASAQPEIESPLEDSGSITFRSESEGMTVVWIAAR